MSVFWQNIKKYVDAAQSMEPVRAWTDAIVAQQNTAEEQKAYMSYLERENEIELLLNLRMNSWNVPSLRNACSLP